MRQGKNHVPARKVGVLVVGKKGAFPGQNDVHRIIIARFGRGKRGGVGFVHEVDDFDSARLVFFGRKAADARIIVLFHKKSIARGGGFVINLRKNNRKNKIDR